MAATDNAEGLTRREGAGALTSPKVVLPGVAGVAGLGIAFGPEIVHAIAHAAPEPVIAGGALAAMAGTAVAGTMVAATARREAVSVAAWGTASAAIPGAIVTIGLLSHSATAAGVGGVLGGVAGALCSIGIVAKASEHGADKAPLEQKATWMRRVAAAPLVVAGAGAVATTIGALHGAPVPMEVAETIMSIGLGAALPTAATAAVATANARRAAPRRAQALTEA